MKALPVVLALLVGLAAPVQAYTRPAPPQGVTLEQLQARAEQGDLASQLTLAEWFLHRPGAHVDARQVYSWCRKAAEAGNAKAQALLAINFYYHGSEEAGIAKDRPTALHWLQLAAAQGQPEATLMAADLLMSGDGVPADPAAALRLIGGMAERGDLDACELLAKTYDEGHGVAADPAAALHWYLEAEKLGGHHARRLGEMYATGLGTPENRAEALRWMLHAAEQEGDHEIANELAEAYAHGSEVPRDLVRARQLFEAAAEGRRSGAIRQLAAMCACGQGGPRDLRQAAKWYAVGIAVLRQDDPTDPALPALVKLQQKLLKQLSPADAQAAADQARAWLKAHAKQP